MEIERMLKELQELKTQAFETRRQSERNDSYYEGINQALDIVKNCTIDNNVSNRRELLIAYLKENKVVINEDNLKGIDDFLNKQSN